MKSRDKGEGLGLEETSYYLEVEDGVVAKVRSGEITHIREDILEYNQKDLLECIYGNPVVVVDGKPSTFHNCYLYNGGVFPYAIKDTLEYLILEDDKDGCLVHIISINISPYVRFNYHGPDKPFEDNPYGDSCVWEVDFEVVPILADQKIFLLRWNPSISSFTEKDYEKCLENMENDSFRLTWSIHEWEEARRGDLFYMLRTGDDKAGIVFNGQFISDPYPGNDWKGSTKRRMYVDMVCVNPEEPGKIPRTTLEKLQKAIPSFDWSKGHSGELLSEEQATKLCDAWKEEDV